MSQLSPTLEGFRAAFRRPSLAFAEISWRWMVGATTCALCFFGLIEFLNTLPVSRGDAALLSTRQPLLMGRAITHILHGSLNRAVGSALVAGLGLMLLWIVAASIGRAATVRALTDYFRSGVARDVAVKHLDVGPALRSLLGLNFLRAAFVLAALLAIAGAAVMVGFVSTEANPRPGLAFVLFLPVAGLVCVVWWMLNWLLSLAALFSVRKNESTGNAISAAVAFCRERYRPVLAVSTWTGIAHLTAFVCVLTLAPMTLAFIQIVPARLVAGIVIFITLIYFAVTDWLYTARLAGYVCIAEMPDELIARPSQPMSPIVPTQMTIDRDELILSDLQGLAMET